MKQKQPPDIRESFIKARIEPLCGWPWLNDNWGKVYPEQGIEIFHDGKIILSLPAEPARRGHTRAAMWLGKQLTKMLIKC